MDHAANDVLKPISIYSTNRFIQRFLELIAHVKGRTTTPLSPLPPYDTFDTVLVDRGLPVTGLYNCVQYLEERYPEPSLFFDTPERRAIARMSLDCLLEQFYYPNQTAANDLDHLLKTVKTQRFLAGDKLSVLDLAFAPTCPVIPDFTPYLTRIRLAIGATP